MVRYPPDVLDCAYFPTADVIEDLTGRALGVTPPAPKPVAFSVLGDYFTATNADRLWVIGERLRVFARSMRALTAISQPRWTTTRRENMLVTLRCRA
jgi:hypothetical protein